MVQTLTVHQAGKEWGTKDVTGSAYGRSPDVFETIEAAERLANRLGDSVSLSREAQNHLFMLGSKKPSSG